MRWKWMTIGVAAACLAIAPTARASDYAVTSTEDAAGTCAVTQCTTIRAALTAVAATPDPAGDTIALQAGTYQLASTLDISVPVALRGAGARTTTIVAASGARTLNVTANAALSHLTISGGEAPTSFGGNLLAQSATVSLDQVHVTGGHAQTGGGIANRNGTMTITNSLIDQNTAAISGAGTGAVAEGAGGGVANVGDALASGALTLRNTTLTLNTGYRAGAVASLGSSGNALTLENVTAFRNSAGLGATGGLFVELGQFSLGSTVLAENKNSGDGTTTNCGGGVRAVSQGFNVETSDTCLVKQASDQVGVADAGLPAAVVTFGGETDVLPPLLDSPVINVKPAGTCLPADQRGVLRPQGAGCDSGAVELAYGTRIDSGPSGTTPQTNPQFGFSSSDGSAAFECALDTPSEPDAAFLPCSTPYTTSGLAAGAYTFHVRAIVGGAPLAEAQRSFTVAPGTPIVIDSGPNGAVKGPSVTFAFTSADAAECRLVTPGDPDPAYAGCASPVTYSGLTTQGAYVFQVQPAVTHDSGLGAARSFAIDTSATPPTFTSPLENAVVGTAFTLAGNASADTTAVELFDNGVSLGNAALTAGSWTLAVDGLPEKTHVFKAVATDAAGNVSDPSDPRTVRVDVTPATVHFFDLPDSPTKADELTFDFLASEDDVTYTCRITPPGANDPDPAEPCETPWIVSDLPTDGTYRFEVSAFDRRNDGPWAGTSIVVDRTAPDPVAPIQADAVASTFTFTAVESDSTFQCRLEGPAGDSGFAPCTSPKAYPGLAVGDYRFTLRTLDALGNAADATKAFSIAAPPVVTPTPTPTPLAEASPVPAATAIATPAPTPVVVATPAPTPQVNETVVVRPSSGTITIRKPGTTTFVALSRTTSIPLGSEIDARKGKVVLTAEPAEGKALERATFYAGLFTVGQVGGYIEATLSEPLAPCKKQAAASAAATAKSRKLWGDGKGKFRTKGQNSSATVRGTQWLVQDSCDGTLTQVKQGVVSVRDVAARKTVLLRAGKKYLAKPKKK